MVESSFWWGKRLNTRDLPHQQCCTAPPWFATTSLSVGTTITVYSYEFCRDEFLFILHPSIRSIIPHISCLTLLSEPLILQNVQKITRLPKKISTANRLCILLCKLYGSTSEYIYHSFCKRMQHVYMSIDIWSNFFFFFPDARVYSLLYEGERFGLLSLSLKCAWK